ncbi:MAG: polynucleotide adenylyltransferase PcnB [Spirochaetaceae bacterium]|nr:polynucleotide adenylyltransferase PcnB [Spirochaetaceae bacterium]
MIVRYATNDKGKTEKIAEIYTKDEHKIEPGDIDSQALFICNKLRRAGYKAYIIGGAVRDLLLKKQPKDFDIVTDAYPTGIRKLFRGSRIIGKRFKLVHVCFSKNIYEVSTFRSSRKESHGNNNFGTMAEDAWRRDFTINTLYYCPKEEQIIDFTGGYKDIKKKVVKPVIPLKMIFIEDPVRIIRAIKYSVVVNGKLPFFLKLRIKMHAKELTYCSSSRLTEEAIKIMKTGCASIIFKKLSSFGILKLIFPSIYNIQKNSWFYEVLNNFDNEIKNGTLSRGEISVLLCPLIENFILTNLNPNNDPVKTMKEVMEEVKSFLKPLTPPNDDIAEAIKNIFKRNNIKLKNIYSARPKGENIRHKGESVRSRSGRANAEKAKPERARPVKQK